MGRGQQHRRQQRTCGPTAGGPGNRSPPGQRGHYGHRHPRCGIKAPGVVERRVFRRDSRTLSTHVRWASVAAASRQRCTRSRACPAHGDHTPDGRSEGIRPTARSQGTHEADRAVDQNGSSAVTNPTRPHSGAGPEPGKKAQRGEQSRPARSGSAPAGVDTSDRQPSIVVQSTVFLSCSWSNLDRAQFNVCAERFSRPPKTTCARR